MHRLRQRCDELLQPGEEILLEAKVAYLKLGRFRQQGIGRAFLTQRRIIWLHGAPRLLLRMFFRLHRVVGLHLEDVRRIRMYKSGGVLFVESHEEHYELRVGQGYPPLLLFFFYQSPRDGQRTTEEWYDAMSQLVPPHAL